MAVQTLLVASVSDESGRARLEVDVDDTSDPADWDLISGRVVNNMARACYVLIQRGNGQNWFEAAVEAGQSVSADAGGPVKTLSDVPRMMLVTR